MSIDKSTLGGIALALTGIVVGLILDGGKLAQVLQPTAALIVIGGTLGAVMVQFPLKIVLQALLHLKYVFFNAEPESDSLVQNLLRYAYKARRDGILSLDADLAKIQDPFLKESLMLAIDGVSAMDLRKMMELQIDYMGEKEERIPKVFESAGGFAPTIGIIGAVLGLIQVMQHLQDINEVGKGIAVAFVATIYGVASANLLFLPWAGKLRIRQRERQIIQEMTLEAVLSIIEQVNPRALELQLRSYIALPVRRGRYESGCAMRPVRQRHSEEPANRDRWLLSYSDFITLLFAFFVVLFASSYRDKQTIKKVSQAIHIGFQQLGAFSEGQSSSGVAYPNLSSNPSLSAAGPERGDWERRSVGRVVSRCCAAAAAARVCHGPGGQEHEVVMRVTAEGFVVSLNELGFFDSGKAELLPGAADKIERIAKVLSLHQLELRVEGNSDDQPIHTPEFRSNWELSTARAMAVMQLLVDDSGFDPRKISVLGYGQYRPIADNATPEGRRMNRRVDLVVVSTTPRSLACHRSASPYKTIAMERMAPQSKPASSYPPDLRRYIDGGFWEG